jgi:hypothetical protein
MSQFDEKVLMDLGQKAADAVAGKGVAKPVAVAIGQDSTDQDAYYFSFLLDRTHSQPGEIRIRLAQKLRDQLMASSDDHYPFVQIFSSTEWERRRSA